MIKQPNPTMKHNQDWSEVDLEAMPEDFIPATAYFPDRTGKSDYDDAYGTWNSANGPVPVASQFRIAWREFAATTGFRTLYPSVIPPGAKHVHAVNSCWYSGNPKTMMAVGAAMSSILYDYYVRSAGTGHIFNDLVRALPFSLKGTILKEAADRYIRLNCLTRAYAPLWERVSGEKWKPDTPIRNSRERELMQVEIDVLIAISHGVTADELCMIYRTQFPVMRRYDREVAFDVLGRKVPKSVLREWDHQPTELDSSSKALDWTNPQSGVEYSFVPPFSQFNREEEMRSAYLRLQSLASGVS